MNGSLYHACRLTAAVKHGGRGGGFRCPQTPYVGSLRFLFRDGETVEGAEDWYRLLRKQRVEDAKVMVPAKLDSLRQTVDVNALPVSVVCFQREGAVTCWQPAWSYDSGRRMWEVVYREVLWENAPKGRPRFTDNGRALSGVLLESETLAKRLEQPAFARRFANARRILRGFGPLEDLGGLGLPSRNRRLFAAASLGNVFGGMGSWNDGLPRVAKERGLEEDYERLSRALYEQLTLAVLYAVNEW